MVSSQLVCGHWYVLEGRKSKRGSRRKKRENKREGKERRKEIEKRRRVDKEIHVIENIFVSFGYIGIVVYIQKAVCRWFESQLNSFFHFP